MVFKFLLSILLLLITLSAQEFPRTFSQLGNPLYSSVKPFSKYKDIANLHFEIEAYEKASNELLLMGYKADKLREKKFMVAYLKKLRKLQKQYSKLLHKLHECIEKSIDDNDYDKFIKLTSYAFDGLFNNRNLLNKAIEFYSKNREKESCAVLDKSVQNSQLIVDTQKLFKAEIIESTYNSNSKKKSKKKVKILISRKNNKIDVKFVNHNMYAVTLKVIPKYINIKPANHLPDEFVIPSNTTLPYTTLKLLSGKSYYGYKYSWTMGSKDAVHDDNYIYRLPFKKGTSHIVSQGYNGLKTHKGRSAYSIDFPMPKGTKIYAARDGIVVKTKSNSNVGGYEKKFASSGNFVRILHSDGTFATYYHLEYKGVLVVVGEKIFKGEAIGYSGNTGYSSGPHLHFAVFKAASARHTQTLPIKMNSAQGIIREPQKGHYYKAK